METLIFDSSVDNVIVSLDPSEIGDIQNNILAKLNAKLLWWDDLLGGIVLAYRKVKVLNSALGSIDFGDYIHYKVRYVVTYFKPEKGKLWIGKVTTVSDTGINLLVLDLINWKILESEDEDNEMSAKDRIMKLSKNSIIEGDMVVFKIEDIQASNNAIMLFGSIPPSK